MLFIKSLFLSLVFILKCFSKKLLSRINNITERNVTLRINSCQEVPILLPYSGDLSFFSYLSTAAGFSTGLIVQLASLRSFSAVSFSNTDRAVQSQANPRLARILIPLW